MKKIFDRVGRIIPVVFILIVIESIAGIIIAQQANDAWACGYMSPVQEIFIDHLIQITTIIILIISIGYYAIGIISYLGSRNSKGKKKNTAYARIMIMRGSISLLIFVLFYFLINVIANLYGVDCGGAFPRFN